MYDSKVGRWLSEDPLGFDAGDVNLARYVGNSPVSFADPDGLQATPVVQNEAIFNARAEAAVAGLDARTKPVVLGLLKEMQKRGNVTGALTYETIVRRGVTFKHGTFPRGVPEGRSPVPPHPVLPPFVELGRLTDGNKERPFFGAELAYRDEVPFKLQRRSAAGAVLGEYEFKVPRFSCEIPLLILNGAHREQRIREAQMLILLHELGHAALGLTDYVDWSKIPEEIQGKIRDLNPTLDSRVEFGQFGSLQGMNPQLENILREEFKTGLRGTYLFCPIGGQEAFDVDQIGDVRSFFRDYGLGTFERAERDLGNGRKQKYFKRVP